MHVLEQELMPNNYNPESNSSTTKTYNNSKTLTAFNVTFRKETEKALRSYERLLEFLLPENSQTVTNAIFTFFCEANIWDWEILSIDMLRIITNILHEEAFHHLLSILQNIFMQN